jgi:hypothetical protein
MTIVNLMVYEDEVHVLLKDSQRRSVNENVPMVGFYCVRYKHHTDTVQHHSYIRCSQSKQETRRSRPNYTGIYRLPVRLSQAHVFQSTLSTFSLFPAPQFLHLSSRPVQTYHTRQVVHPFLLFITGHFRQAGEIGSGR